MIDLKPGDYLKKITAQKIDENRMEYCTIIYLCLQVSHDDFEQPTAIITPIVKHVSFWETCYNYDDIELGYTIQIVKARVESIFTKTEEPCSWRITGDKWIWDSGCAILPHVTISLPNPRDLNTVIVERCFDESLQTEDEG